MKYHLRLWHSVEGLSISPTAVVNCLCDWHFCQSTTHAFASLLFAGLICFSFHFKWVPVVSVWPLWDAPRHASVCLLSTDKRRSIVARLFPFFPPSVPLAAVSVPALQKTQSRVWLRAISECRRSERDGRQGRTRGMRHVTSDSLNEHKAAQQLHQLLPGLGNVMHNYENMFPSSSSPMALNSFAGLRLIGR